MGEKETNATAMLEAGEDYQAKTTTVKGTKSNTDDRTGVNDSAGVEESTGLESEADGPAAMKAGTVKFFNEGRTAGETGTDAAGEEYSGHSMLGASDRTTEADGEAIARHGPSAVNVKLARSAGGDGPDGGGMATAAIGHEATHTVQQDRMQSVVQTLSGARETGPESDAARVANEPFIRQDPDGLSLAVSANPGGSVPGLAVPEAGGPGVPVSDKTAHFGGSSEPQETPPASSSVGRWWRRRSRAPGRS